MAPLRRLEATALPLPRANIDTDQILPARFLKKPRSDNFGEYLFRDTRAVLESPAHQGARIVVAGRNFGCGSSREHAVWALCDYGFRAAIAPAFGDIFAGNAAKNGFLAVVLKEEVVAQLLESLKANPATRISIDLEAQTVNGVHRFDIDPFARHCLLEGMDELGYTLTQLDRIQDFEKGYRA